MLFYMWLQNTGYRHWRSGRQVTVNVGWFDRAIRNARRNITRDLRRMLNRA